MFKRFLTQTAAATVAVVGLVAASRHNDRHGAAS